MAQNRLTVTVTNVKDGTGNVRVGLFTEKGKFLKETYQGKTVPAANNQVVVVFENIPSGKYAISVIHDENGNGELDSNFMGIPKEGFGFGNDAMGMFGPPSFEDAIIQCEGTDKAVSVKLRYM
jgi:uncharacterized protein (DUF2141 family)